MRLRMAKAALEPRQIDTALKFADLAGYFLLAGRPEMAISAYKAGACYAETEQGAWTLRAMAGELEMGLLRTATVH